MIEGVVFTALKGLVSDRCYPDTFPQPTSETLPIWPAIRYSVISRVNLPDICGTDDIDTDDTRVQIDIVALSKGAALVLKDQVIAAMMGLSPPAVRDIGFDIYDPETKTYRCTLDYFFSSSSPLGSP